MPICALYCISKYLRKRCFHAFKQWLNNIFILVAGRPPGKRLNRGRGGGNLGDTIPSGGQNDEFRPLTSTLGGRGMGCRDKYVIS